MYTVFAGKEYLKSDHRPKSPVRDKDGEIGYIASGPKDTSDVRVVDLSCLCLR